MERPEIIDLTGRMEELGMMKPAEPDDVIHLRTGADPDGIVTACGPWDPALAHEGNVTSIPTHTTCPQCRRNPFYNFSLPIALRPNEARRFA